MSASLDSIKKFFSNKNIAVVGVSGTGKGFGYTAYKKLKDSGYNVFPVNNKRDEIEGNKCYNSLSELKGKTESVVLVIPPVETKNVVMQASEAGMNNIWFQPGSESKDAVKLASDLKLNVIDKECIIMFTEPIHGFHRFHRAVTKLTGRYPK